MKDSPEPQRVLHNLTDAEAGVNQRALINKMLSRYSGEFNLFRELLQNSDDANSSAVEIHFETEAYRDGMTDLKEQNIPPDLMSIHVSHWTIKNDGNKFNKDDWQRLATIALGNPNSDKIGAFGVGFYTVFSVSESPFVSSGGQGMEFYWKGNKLHTRRGDHPSASGYWTVFELPLRSPAPMPRLLELTQFLATSITFMVRLRDIRVFFNEHQISWIKKSLGPSQPIDYLTGMGLLVHQHEDGIPTIQRDLRHSTTIAATKKAHMSIRTIRHCLVTVEAEVMDVVFTSANTKDAPSLAGMSTKSNMDAKSKDCMQLRKSKAVLTMFTAEVVATVGEGLSRELDRCMMKPFPESFEYTSIYIDKDEHDQRCPDEQDGSPRDISIFQGVRANLDGQSLIFIGHATAQTTGIGGHMMSQFIPTIERELMDLTDTAVATWNLELIRIGGLLSRAIYEWELSDINSLWGKGATSEPDHHDRLQDSQDRLHQHFLYILKFFGFHRSTPSRKVSDLLKSSFCQCSTEPLRLLSSRGVLNSSSIKAFDPDLEKFLRYIPMLSYSATALGARIIAALPAPHKVLEITTTEVFEYLRTHNLTSEEMVACLQWWMRLRASGKASKSHDADLLNSASFSDVGGNGHQLSLIQYFVDSQGPVASIPSDGPLPSSLIPVEISEHFPREDLESLGWREFTIITWLQHITDPVATSANPEYDITKSSDWAEHVLDIVSAAWSSLSQEVHLAAKSAFTGKKCIPTSHHQSLPEDSYLPGVNDALFDHSSLPVVQFKKYQISTTMRDLLSFIGVHAHAPLELLLDKQVYAGNWTIYQFIHHLAQLPAAVREQYSLELKRRTVFHTEGTQAIADITLRYRADELYPPNTDFRNLKLPIIGWGEEWRNDSREAKFMYNLGLRLRPTFETIVELCFSQSEIRDVAFKYLCTNLRSQYYGRKPEDFRDKALIPAETQGEDATLRKPGEVFLCFEWKKLGFAVVPSRYRDIIEHLESIFGLEQDPPTSMMIQFLPPKGEKARKWLEMLSKHTSKFTRPELETLSTLKIVPTGLDDELQTPKKCYLGKPSNLFYSTLFTFVSFDSSVAHFLQTCGSNNQPSVPDIAAVLLDNPSRFYRLAGKDLFLEELRRFAHYKKHFPNNTMEALCGKATLLGEKCEIATGEEGSKPKHELKKPEDIVIADDDADYELFRNSIFIAPRDELLQNFYRLLGCQRLSESVQTRYHDPEETSNPETRAKYRDLIRQRLPFFLQNCSQERPRADVPDLDVKVWKKLLVSKDLLVNNGDHITIEQEVWCMIPENNKSGRVELWLSDNVEEDMYQLATCLCRFLFRAVKVRDTLFLQNILSMDALKARRFITQPALQQEKESQKLLSNDEENLRNAPEVTSPIRAVTPTNCDPSTAFSISCPSSSNITSSANRSDGEISTVTRLRGIGSSISEAFSEGTSFWTPRSPTGWITQDEIHHTVKAAIAVCHPDQRKLARGRLSKLTKTQFLNSYCETPAEYLQTRTPGRIVDGIEVHLLQGGRGMDLHRHESLGRFIQIIIPIAQVYELSITSLHIFRDATPGRIAFNRSGDLFLNLLHFEKWHDQTVRNGHRQQCQASWFLTLAHEIAHNIIQLHNTVHEFWFSEICEAYFVKFVQDVLCQV